MAFRTYANISEAAKSYGLRLITAPDRLPMASVAAPATLKEDIDLTIRMLPYDVSEAAICESLIYPVLREVWKQFADIFMIWSHQPISIDNDLTGPPADGIPDYLFTRQSPLGSTILDIPYVAVIEAKRDDFTRGWAQCSLEMYAIQQLNQDSRTVYGIVSNGRLWEIASLTDGVITRYPEGFAIRDLDELFATLVQLLETCKRIYNL